MKNRALLCGCAALLLGLLVVGGCNREPRYALIPVKGQLKIDGKPAAGIVLQFMPDIMSESRGPTSQGTSDENGMFNLVTTDNKPGAVAGTHIVTFFDTLEERPAQGEAATKPPRLSSNYSTAAGGVKVEIVAGQDVNLDIPSTPRGER